MAILEWQKTVHSSHSVAIAIRQAVCLCFNIILSITRIFKDAGDVREMKMKQNVFIIIPKERDKQKDPNLYLSKLQDIQSSDSGQLLQNNAD